ncbi:MULTISPECIES: Wzz/FepE/Etk N-terminal domain-containing protein [unclassified Prochlorococcus]|uniref:Wzz/FepE/Etk N-terminal domain-containing protein n=1 Tax=unclassified Prochlorococcus TaxID=2627481 RepID=UPI0005339B87|nr:MULTISPECIES: Wzz/FepE/Etk N-terminal domain-containing protein [unclassified Prochlorococcus]KGG16312.1 hypothetical protein EV07_1481 [Prochlorococcus sp. MIT 0603]KGG17954.1 hypothetical protein EV06_0077 [Prochlorococcus sp. MIT 0602]
MDNSNNQSYLNNDYDKDDIDLSKVYKRLKRNRSTILPVSFVITFGVIISTYIRKPVWEGSFQIIIQRDTPAEQAGSLADVNRVDGLQVSLQGYTSDDLKTQVVILESPSVLKPVYKSVKTKKYSQGLTKYNPTYKQWIDDHLSIDLKKGTKVLTVNYKDTDKQLILSTLRMVSSKYQAYSRKDRLEKLDKGIDYLKLQVKQSKEKSSKSMKTFNSFSIQHGLGNADGLFGSDDPSPGIVTYDLSGKKAAVKGRLGTYGANFGAGDNGRSGAARRYKTHFKLLEQYEADYAELSSKLKPNSSVLKELKSRVEGLRVSLDRPNKIIAEFRELKRIALRDEALLQSLETNLDIALLEQARQEDPWDLISEPTLSDYRVSPKRSIETVITFLSSITILGLILILREKNSGILYYFYELNNEIPYRFMQTIYKNNIELNDRIISNIIESNKIKASSKGLIGIASISDDSMIKGPNNTYSLFKADNSITFIDPFDKNDIEKCSSIILLFEKGSLSSTNLKLTNEYLQLYKDKILGWLLLDTKTIFPNI